MNTHGGYSKRTLTDTNVLLTGGGDKSLAGFLGGIQYVSASHKILIKTAAANASWTDLVTLVTTDENVKLTPKTDNTNRPLMMINGGTGAGEQTSTSMFSTGIYANASTNMITAAGFIKTGSDSSHVLLGDGGHKSVSDFATSTHNHDDKYVTFVGVTDDSTNHKNQLRYVLNGTSNYFTVPYSTTSGTSDATYFLYARSSALKSPGVQFIQGQIKTGSSDGLAYSGSSSNFKVLSFPPNATAINSQGTTNESANVAIFRIAWGTTYWHDLHFSPNNNNIYHRVVFNSNAIDWRTVVETTGNKGNSTKPVYVSGGLIYECDTYPTKASWNYDDVYLKLTGGTLSGTLTIAPTNSSGWQKGLSFYDAGGGDGETCWIEWSSSSHTTPVKLAGAPDGKTLNFNDGTNWYTVYHSGNLSVNNAILTLTAGTTSKTFTANASTDVSFTVPDVSKSTKGLCPILPNETTVTKFLRLDGTWLVPAYPTVNNGNLYLQASGTTKTTFTANLSGNSTFNIATGSSNGTISVGGTDVAVKGLGSNAYTSDSYLVKTTYDYHKEFSSGGSGYIEIGCFSLYDSMVGVDVTLTTSSSWNGRLIISSLNINSSGGGSYYATIRGDNSISMHDKFSIVRSGTYFRVYLNCSGWMKVFCHIWCVAATASELFTTVSSMPTGNITVNNDSGTFGGNVYATNFYTTSDRNKKTNISSFSEHIRKFQLKDTEKYAYGVIAQEVEEMFRDGEEGNMTVNYNSILSFYIGQLENKVKILEERIKRLESK